MDNESSGARKRRLPISSSSSINENSMPATALSNYIDLPMMSPRSFKHETSSQASRETIDSIPSQDVAQPLQSLSKIVESENYQQLKRTPQRAIRKRLDISNTIPMTSHEDRWAIAAQSAASSCSESKQSEDTNRELQLQAQRQKIAELKLLTEERHRSEQLEKQQRKMVSLRYTSDETDSSVEVARSREESSDSVISSHNQASDTRATHDSQAVDIDHQRDSISSHMNTPITSELDRVDGALGVDLEVTTTTRNESLSYQNCENSVKSWTEDYNDAEQTPSIEETKFEQYASSQASSWSWHSDSSPNLSLPDTQDHHECPPLNQARFSNDMLKHSDWSQESEASVGNKARVSCDATEDYSDASWVDAFVDSRGSVASEHEMSRPLAPDVLAKEGGVDACQKNVDSDLDSWSSDALPQVNEAEDSIRTSGSSNSWTASDQNQGPSETCYVPCFSDRNSDDYNISNTRGRSESLPNPNPFTKNSTPTPVCLTILDGNDVISQDSQCNADENWSEDSRTCATRDSAQNSCDIAVASSRRSQLDAEVLPDQGICDDAESIECITMMALIGGQPSGPNSGDSNIGHIDSRPVHEQNGDKRNNHSLTSCVEKPDFFIDGEGDLCKDQGNISPGEEFSQAQGTSPTSFNDEDSLHANVVVGSNDLNSIVAAVSRESVKAYTKEDHDVMIHQNVVQGVNLAPAEWRLSHDARKEIQESSFTTTVSNRDHEVVSGPDVSFPSASIVSVPISGSSQNYESHHPNPPDMRASASGNSLLGANRIRDSERSSDGGNTVWEISVLNEQVLDPRSTSTSAQAKGLRFRSESLMECTQDVIELTNEENCRRVYRETDFVKQQSLQRSEPRKSRGSSVVQSRQGRELALLNQLVDVKSLVSKEEPCRHSRTRDLHFRFVLMEEPGAAKDFDIMNHAGDSCHPLIKMKTNMIQTLEQQRRRLGSLLEEQSCQRLLMVKDALGRASAIIRWHPRPSSALVRRFPEDTHDSLRDHKLIDTHEDTGSSQVHSGALHQHATNALNASLDIANPSTGRGSFCTSLKASASQHELHASLNESVQYLFDSKRPQPGLGITKPLVNAFAKPRSEHDFLTLGAFNDRGQVRLPDKTLETYQSFDVAAINRKADERHTDEVNSRCSDSSGSDSSSGIEDSDFGHQRMTPDDRSIASSCASELKVLSSHDTIRRYVTDKFTSSVESHQALLGESSSTSSGSRSNSLTLYQSEHNEGCNNEEHIDESQWSDRSSTTRRGRLPNPWQRDGDTMSSSFCSWTESMNDARKDHKRPIQKVGAEVDECSNVTWTSTVIVPPALGSLRSTGDDIDDAPEDMRHSRLLAHLESAGPPVRGHEKSVSTFGTWKTEDPNTRHEMLRSDGDVDDVTDGICRSRLLAHLESAGPPALGHEKSVSTFGTWKTEDPNTRHEMLRSDGTGDDDVTDGMRRSRLSVHLESAGPPALGHEKSVSTFGTWKTEDPKTRPEMLRSDGTGDDVDDVTDGTCRSRLLAHLESAGPPARGHEKSVSTFGTLKTEDLNARPEMLRSARRDEDEATTMTWKTYDDGFDVTSAPNQDDVGTQQFDITTSMNNNDLGIIGKEHVIRSLSQHIQGSGASFKPCAGNDESQTWRHSAPPIPTANLNAMTDDVDDVDDDTFTSWTIEDNPPMSHPMRRRASDGGTWGNDVEESEDSSLEEHMEAVKNLLGDINSELGNAADVSCSSDSFDSKEGIDFDDSESGSSDGVWTLDHTESEDSSLADHMRTVESFLGASGDAESHSSQHYPSRSASSESSEGVDFDDTVTNSTWKTLDDQKSWSELNQHLNLSQDRLDHVLPMRTEPRNLMDDVDRRILDLSLPGGDELDAVDLLTNPKEVDHELNVSSPMDSRFSLKPGEGIHCRDVRRSGGSPNSGNDSSPAASAAESSSIFSDLRPWGDEGAGITLGRGLGKVDAPVDVRDAGASSHNGRTSPRSLVSGSSSNRSDVGRPAITDFKSFEYQDQDASRASHNRHDLATTYDEVDHVAIIDESRWGDCRASALVLERTFDQSRNDETASLVDECVSHRSAVRQQVYTNNRDNLDERFLGSNSVSGLFAYHEASSYQSWSSRFETDSLLNINVPVDVGDNVGCGESYEGTTLQRSWGSGSAAEKPDEEVDRIDNLDKEELQDCDDDLVDQLDQDLYRGNRDEHDLTTLKEDDLENSKTNDDDDDRGGVDSGVNQTSLLVRTTMSYQSSGFIKASNIEGEGRSTNIRSCERSWAEEESERDVVFESIPQSEEGYDRDAVDESIQQSEEGDEGGVVVESTLQSEGKKEKYAIDESIPQSEEENERDVLDESFPQSEEEHERHVVHEYILQFEIGDERHVADESIPQPADDEPATLQDKDMDRYAAIQSDRHTPTSHEDHIQHLPKKYETGSDKNIGNRASLLVRSVKVTSSGEVHYAAIGKQADESAAFESDLSSFGQETCVGNDYGKVDLGPVSVRSGLFAYDAASSYRSWSSRGVPVASNDNVGDGESSNLIGSQRSWDSGSKTRSSDGNRPGISDRGRDEQQDEEESTASHDDPRTSSAHWDGLQQPSRMDERVGSSLDPNAVPPLAQSSLSGPSDDEYHESIGERAGQSNGIFSDARFWVKTTDAGDKDGKVDLSPVSERSGLLAYDVTSSCRSWSSRDVPSDNNVVDGEDSKGTGSQRSWDSGSKTSCEQQDQEECRASHGDAHRSSAQWDALQQPSTVDERGGGDLDPYPQSCLFGPSGDEYHHKIGERAGQNDGFSSDAHLWFDTTDDRGNVGMVDLGPVSERSGLFAYDAASSYRSWSSRGVPADSDGNFTDGEGSKSKRSQRSWDSGSMTRSSDGNRPGISDDSYDEKEDEEESRASNGGDPGTNSAHGDGLQQPSTMGERVGDDIEPCRVSLLAQGSGFSPTGDLDYYSNGELPGQSDGFCSDVYSRVETTDEAHDVGKIDLGPVSARSGLFAYDATSSCRSWSSRGVPVELDDNVTDGEDSKVIVSQRSWDSGPKTRSSGADRPGISDRSFGEQQEEVESRASYGEPCTSSARWDGLRQPSSMDESAGGDIEHYPVPPFAQSSLFGPSDDVYHDSIAERADPSDGFCFDAQLWVETTDDGDNDGNVDLGPVSEPSGLLAYDAASSYRSWSSRGIPADLDDNVSVGESSNITRSQRSCRPESWTRSSGGDRPGISDRGPGEQKDEEESRASHDDPRASSAEWDGLQQPSSIDERAEGDLDLNAVPRLAQGSLLGPSDDVYHDSIGKRAGPSDGFSSNAHLWVERTDDEVFEFDQGPVSERSGLFAYDAASSYRSWSSRGAPVASNDNVGDCESSNETGSQTSGNRPKISDLDRCVHQDEEESLANHLDPGGTSALGGGRQQPSSIGERPRGDIETYRASPVAQGNGVGPTGDLDNVSSGERAGRVEATDETHDGGNIDLGPVSVLSGMFAYDAASSYRSWSSRVVPVASNDNVGDGESSNVTGSERSWDSRSKTRSSDGVSPGFSDRGPGEQQHEEESTASHDDRRTSSAQCDGLQQPSSMDERTWGDIETYRTSPLAQGNGVGPTGDQDDVPNGERAGQSDGSCSNVHSRVEATDEAHDGGKMDLGTVSVRSGLFACDVASSYRSWSSRGVPVELDDNVTDGEDSKVAGSLRSWDSGSKTRSSDSDRPGISDRGPGEQKDEEESRMRHDDPRTSCAQWDGLQQPSSNYEGVGGDLDPNAVPPLAQDSLMGPSDDVYHDSIGERAGQSDGFGSDAHLLVETTDDGGNVGMVDLGPVSERSGLLAYDASSSYRSWSSRGAPLDDNIVEAEDSKGTGSQRSWDSESTMRSSDGNRPRTSDLDRGVHHDEEESQASPRASVSVHSRVLDPLDSVDDATVGDVTDAIISVRSDARSRVEEVTTIFNGEDVAFDSVSVYSDVFADDTGSVYGSIRLSPKDPLVKLTRSVAESSQIATSSSSLETGALSNMAGVKRSPILGKKTDKMDCDPTSLEGIRDRIQDEIGVTRDHAVILFGSHDETRCSPLHLECEVGLKDKHSTIGWVNVNVEDSSPAIGRKYDRSDARNTDVDSVSLKSWDWSNSHGTLSCRMLDGNSPISNHTWTSRESDLLAGLVQSGIMKASDNKSLVECDFVNSAITSLEANAGDRIRRSSGGVSQTIDDVNSLKYIATRAGHSLATTSSQTKGRKHEHFKVDWVDHSKSGLLCEDFPTTSVASGDSEGTKSESSGLEDESSVGFGEGSIPSAIDANRTSGSVFSDVSSGVHSSRYEGVKVQRVSNVRERTNAEKTKTYSASLPGNLFAVPKRRRASTALLDDPAYEINYGVSKFDDLSGKWGERKEKYEALYETKVELAEHVDSAPFKEPPDALFMQEQGEQPKPPSSSFWPMKMFGLNLSRDKVGASTLAEQGVGKLQTSGDLPRGDKEKKTNRQRRVRYSALVTAEIPAFNEPLKMRGEKRSQILPIFATSNATNEGDKPSDSVTFARRTSLCRRGEPVDTNFKFFAGISPSAYAVRPESGHQAADSDLEIGKRFIGDKLRKNSRDEYDPWSEEIKYEVDDQLAESQHSSFHVKPGAFESRRRGRWTSDPPATVTALSKGSETGCFLVSVESESDMRSVPGGDNVFNHPHPATFDQKSFPVESGTSARSKELSECSAAVDSFSDVDAEDTSKPTRTTTGKEKGIGDLLVGWGEIYEGSSTTEDSLNISALDNVDIHTSTYPDRQSGNELRDRYPHERQNLDVSSRCDTILTTSLEETTNESPFDSHSQEKVNECHFVKAADLKNYVDDDIESKCMELMTLTVPARTSESKLDDYLLPCSSIGRMSPFLEEQKLRDSSWTDDLFHRSEEQNHSKCSSSSSDRGISEFQEVGQTVELGDIAHFVIAQVEEPQKFSPDDVDPRESECYGGVVDVKVEASAKVEFDDSLEGGMLQWSDEDYQSKSSCSSSKRGKSAFREERQTVQAGDGAHPVIAHEEGFQKVPLDDVDFHKSEYYADAVEVVVQAYPIIEFDDAHDNTAYPTQVEVVRDVNVDGDSTMASMASMAGNQIAASVINPIKVDQVVDSQLFELTKTGSDSFADNYRDNNDVQGSGESDLATDRRRSTDVDASMSDIQEDPSAIATDYRSKNEQSTSFVVHNDDHELTQVPGVSLQNIMEISMNGEDLEEKDVSCTSFIDAGIHDDAEAPDGMSPSSTKFSPEPSSGAQEESQCDNAELVWDSPLLSSPKETVMISDEEIAAVPKALEPASDSETRSRSSSGSYSSLYTGTSHTGSYSSSYTSTSSRSDQYSETSSQTSGWNGHMGNVDIENQLLHVGDALATHIEDKSPCSDYEIYAQVSHKSGLSKLFSPEGIALLLCDSTKNGRPLYAGSAPDIETGTSADTEESVSNPIPSSNKRHSFDHIGIEELPHEFEVEKQLMRHPKMPQCFFCWMGSRRAWTVLVVTLVLVVSILLGVFLREKKDSPPTLVPTNPTFAPTLAFENREWIQLGDAFEGVDLRDQAGFVVALSMDGQTVAVGARRSSAEGLINRGNVKLYRFEFNRWYLIGDLYGIAARNQFGFSISISENGSRIAVGSVGDDSNGENSGMVEVYEHQSSTWTQVGRFFGQLAGDVFGTSVSMSADGRLVAVGAPYRTPAADLERSGEVYFYEDIGFDSPRWVESRRNISGTTRNDYFGWSVSLSSDGSRVAIGAPLDGERDDPGYVRLFSYSGIDDKWTELGKEINNGEGADRFGYSVSMDGTGNRVAVGAVKGTNGVGVVTGNARVYGVRDGIWYSGQLLSGQSESSNFGYSVSLSADGDFLAVGAPNQSNNPGNGRVSVFGLSDSMSWISSVPLESGVDQSSFGFSVSLTSNATRVAVGMPTANEAKVYS